MLDADARAEHPPDPTRGPRTVMWADLGVGVSAALGVFAGAFVGTTLHRPGPRRVARHAPVLAIAWAVAVLVAALVVAAGVVRPEARPAMAVAGAWCLFAAAASASLRPLPGYLARTRSFRGRRRAEVAAVLVGLGLFAVAITVWLGPHVGFTTT